MQEGEGQRRESERERERERERAGAEEVKIPDRKATRASRRQTCVFGNSTPKVKRELHDHHMPAIGSELKCDGASMVASCARPRYLIKHGSGKEDGSYRIATVGFSGSELSASGRKSRSERLDRGYSGDPLPRSLFSTSKLAPILDVRFCVISSTFVWAPAFSVSAGKMKHLCQEGRLSVRRSLS